MVACVGHGGAGCAPWFLPSWVHLLGGEPAVPPGTNSGWQLVGSQAYTVTQWRPHHRCCSRWDSAAVRMVERPGHHQQASMRPLGLLQSKAVCLLKYKCSAFLSSGVGSGMFVALRTAVQVLPRIAYGIVLRTAVLHL